MSLKGERRTVERRLRLLLQSHLFDMNDFFTRGLIQCSKYLFGICLKQLSDLPTIRTSMISKVKGKARVFVPRSEGAG
jgi:hypothetical protein